MIDSIKIEIPKQIDLDIIPDHTMRIKEGEILYITGKIGPFDVIINPRQNITRIFGSIRKYYLGNNELGDLNFTQLSIALINLRQQLKLTHEEFSESRILRIDAGTTIPVERDIHEYFHAITSYPRLEKVTWEDSVEFRGAYKKLIFYNKVLKESKVNSGQLYYYGQPVHGHDLLRFEVQLRRMSALQNQLPIRYMDQLVDQSHLIWGIVLTEFCRVIFSSTGSFRDGFEVSNTSQVRDALLLLLGKAQAYEIVDNWYKEGKIKYNHKYAIYQGLKEMENQLNPDYDYKSSIFAELSDHILKSSFPYILSLGEEIPGATFDDSDIEVDDEFLKDLD